MKEFQTRIACLFMDIDGTLTDGKIYIGPQGEAMKAFSVRDGQGISNLLALPEGKRIEPVILTARESEIVNVRCRELGITQVFQGVKDKVSIIKKFETGGGVFAYIGDDTGDIPAMLYIKEKGGLIACPGDAHDSVKAIADFICSRNGGDVAVRQFVDYLMK